MFNSCLMGVGLLRDNVNYIPTTFINGEVIIYGVLVN